MIATRSIALRLAALFAAAALGVFTLIGIALHRVFDQAIEAHQFEELDTKFRDIEYIIKRVRTPEQWARIHLKLDALTPPDGSTRYWIWSDDPNVQYGTSRAEIASMSGGSRSGNDAGRGQATIERHEAPIVTRNEYFPADANHPALRFMVGIDSTPFLHTEREFEQALIAWSTLGVILVAVLGYWAARFGLLPLQRISRDAQQIGVKHRSRRLDTMRLPSELSDLGLSFNGALDRLEGAYQKLEAFNADVTHELRTPLANLIGQTQVALSRERSAAELEETLRSNLEELERLRSIISDMLFLARADQGEKAMSLVSASLAEEVHKTVEFLDLITDEAGVTVRVEGDANAPVERSLLRRAITNLLHNAIRHTRSHDEIVVRLSETEADAQIAISNPGPEIPREHIGRIFDRFYRVDSARPNSGENHGLGLSIVKAVASMHAGTVFASSGSGMTTVGFTVARTAAAAR
jgi:two-component system heavy metal sensor histidine kinase CusS